MNKYLPFFVTFSAPARNRAAMVQAMLPSYLGLDRMKSATLSAVQANQRESENRAVVRRREAQTAALELEIRELFGRIEIPDEALKGLPLLSAIYDSMVAEEEAEEPEGGEGGGTPS